MWTSLSTGKIIVQNFQLKKGKQFVWYDWLKYSTKAKLFLNDHLIFLPENRGHNNYSLSGIYNLWIENLKWELNFSPYLVSHLQISTNSQWNLDNEFQTWKLWTGANNWYPNCNCTGYWGRIGWARFYSKTSQSLMRHLPPPTLPALVIQSWID